jgi:hypothetical protein
MAGEECSRPDSVCMRGAHLARSPSDTLESTTKLEANCWFASSPSRCMMAESVQLSALQRLWGGGVGQGMGQ